MAYIEMISRAGDYSWLVVNAATGAILIEERGFTADELPQHGKEWTGTANFYRAI